MNRIKSLLAAGVIVAGSALSALATDPPDVTAAGTAYTSNFNTVLGILVTVLVSMVGYRVYKKFLK